MGIYSRDYVRESSGRGGGWGDDIPAVKRLIIITVVAFILQLVLPSFTDWFSLSVEDIRQGQVWRFVTYAFLHDTRSPLHILFNMLGLWWFGAEIERIYGSKEFTVFYLSAAAAAGAGFVVWQLAMNLPNPVVGASGAVLALLTLFATHFPRHTIYIYGIIPLEIRWLIALYVAWDLYPVLLALGGQMPMSHVAHAAHLIGIAFGWMYRHYDWRLSGWFDLSAIQSLPRRWRQARTKRTIRVYEEEPPSATDIDTEVDRILAKITEQGSGSLTDREQAILTKASQQYKNRK